MKFNVQINEGDSLTDRSAEHETPDKALANAVSLALKGAIAGRDDIKHIELWAELIVAFKPKQANIKDRGDARIAAMIDNYADAVKDTD